MFALCHLSSAIFQCQAQNALGKHPSDRVLPALFSGPNGTLNANTLIQGLNQYGTMPGTNTTVFGAGGSAGALTNSESRPVYLTNSLAVRSGFFQQLVTGGNVTNGFNMSQTTPGQLDIDWLRTAGTSSGANLITVRSNGAVQFHGVVSGDGSGLTNLSGGTSGALTNNHALAVSLEDDLTVKGGTLTLGTSSSENVIQAASGQVSFSQSLQALGAFITGRTIIATNFTGNGEGLTNISIAPFGVSATNTFYAVNTNAITIVSNATYSSIVISGSGAVAENIDGTYHYFNTYTLTNSSGTKSVVGTIDGIVITNLARASILVVTNPTYPSISGGNVAAYIGSFSTIGFPMVTPFTDILGNDGGTEITSASVSSVSTNGEASHPKFHGDAASLYNIPVNGDGLTVTNIQVTNVNFNLVNPNTGTPFVRVGNWFSFGTTNAEPAMIGFSSTIHGTANGVAMIGMGVGDVVLDPGYANGRVLQIGNSGNAGAYYYMQYAMLPDATFTNGFSHPLEFRSRSYFSGSARSHYPGIVGVPHYGNTDFAGELVFYARAPHWNLNNKQQTAPDTAGTE